MSNEKQGSEPAFPNDNTMDCQPPYCYGMSKRFYAACTAMQGILSNSSLMESLSKIYPTWKDAPKMKTHLINLAYEYTDELLKHENK